MAAPTMMQIRISFDFMLGATYIPHPMSKQVHANPNPMHMHDVKHVVVPCGGVENSNRQCKLNYFDIQTTFPGAAFWEFPLLSC
jgi:hypothetical protein